MCERIRHNYAIILFPITQHKVSIISTYYCLYSIPYASTWNLAWKCGVRMEEGACERVSTYWTYPLNMAGVVSSPFHAEHALCIMLFASKHIILVPRGRAPFGQHQESRPLARANTGRPRFPSLCACSGSSLTNLIGSGLNLLCIKIH